MTTVNTTSPYVATPSSIENPAGKGAQGDPVITQGINMMYLYMVLCMQQMNDQVQVGQAKTERATASGDMSSRVNTVIAKLKAGDTAPVPDDVIQYMRDNNILVNGKSIDDFIAANQTDGKLDVADLNAIKSALDSDQSSCQDMNTQSSLQMQKTMQSYNMLVSMIQNMQSLLKDMNLGIINKIS